MCIPRATVGLSAVSCLVVPAFICIDLLISRVLKINDDDDDDDDLAAATLKARSPNFKRVLGTRKSHLVAECRTVPRDASEETGCRRSAMYVGALPMTI